MQDMAHSARTCVNWITSRRRGLRPSNPIHRMNNLRFSKTSLETIFSIRHAQQNNGAENVGPQQCTMPGNPRPPVVSYDDCARIAEGIDEANNSSAQLENVVVLDGLWPVCLAVAALIRRDDVVPCLSQRLRLAPPRVPQIRNAVAKDN